MNQTLLRSGRNLSAALVLAVASATGCAAPKISLPAERASLSPNLQLATTRASEPTAGAPQPTTLPAISGFRGRGDQLTFRVNTPGGLYYARITYRTRMIKGYTLKVNDLAYDAFFAPSGDTFAVAEHGVIELPKGEAEIHLGGGWGYYEIAGIELTPTKVPPPPKRPKAVPVNPAASPEARALLKKLTDNYGKTTFTGVYSLEDVKFVQEKTGHTPAVLGGDLMDYSPSRVERGTTGDNETEKLIASARTGKMITVSWHWNAPKDLLDRVDTDANGNEVNKRWYKGFNTNATTFDVAKAMSDPNSEDYKLLVRDIDVIAEQLKKFQDAKVPVLWRPLHEAEGKWFWWGAKGPEAYVKLWRMMYDRLTYHHKLSNLLWVYTGGMDNLWYPGDRYVDIVGVDLYPGDSRDPTTFAWDTVLRQYDGKKILALTEVGFMPDIDRMRRHGVYWAYYNTWTGRLGPQGMKEDELKARMQSKLIRGGPTPAAR
jgi:mannan endo-1,4-beta-mannosidase